MYNKKTSSQKAQAFLKKSQKKIDELKEKLIELSKREDKLEKEKEEQIKLEHRREAKEIRVTLNVESVVKSMIAILLILGFTRILGILQPVIVIFLVALFLSATLNPAVDKLHGYKVPRPLGIILLYIGIIGIFVVMFSSLVPIIAEQVGDLAVRIQKMIQNLVSGGESDSWIVKQMQPYVNQLWKNIDQTEVLAEISSTLQGVASRLTNFAGNAIGAIFTVFNGIFNLVLVLVITFFMVVNKHHTSNFFHSLFPHRYSAYISLKSKQISTRIGEWVRGQMLLAIAMSVLTFVVFSLMGLNYALTLALLSGLAEFVPYLGPIITFGSAALIAFNQDPALVIWLIGAYAVIQFIEGNILVPLIVGRSVGLNPIVVIFSLLCGAALGAGLGGSLGLALVGMILAVPTANIISLFVEDYTVKNK